MSEVDPESCENVQNLVRRLFEDRNELIIFYYAISGVQYSSGANVLCSDVPTVDELQELCQVLVDYIAFGHFEVYEEIINQAIMNMVMTEIYKKIEQNTVKCLEINDILETFTSNQSKINILLSQLGEILEDRFELEDILIQQYFQPISVKHNTD